MKAIRKSLLGLAAMVVASVSALGQGRMIYSDTADAHAEIAQAVRTAASEHKHIILDFGGNWCGDCQVLDIYMHQEPNLSIL